MKDMDENNVSSTAVAIIMYRTYVYWNNLLLQLLHLPEARVSTCLSEIQVSTFAILSLLFCTNIWEDYGTYYGPIGERLTKSTSGLWKRGCCYCLSHHLSNLLWNYSETEAKTNIFEVDESSINSPKHFCIFECKFCCVLDVVRCSLQSISCYRDVQWYVTQLSLYASII